MISSYFYLELFAMSFFFGKREAVGSGTERKSSAQRSIHGVHKYSGRQLPPFFTFQVTPLHRCFRNTQWSPAALSQAALSSGIGLFTSDRISSWCSSLIRPTAIASITQR